MIPRLVSSVTNYNEALRGGVAVEYSFRQPVDIGTVNTNSRFREFEPRYVTPGFVGVGESCFGRRYVLLESTLWNGGGRRISPEGLRAKFPQRVRFAMQPSRTASRRSCLHR